MKEKPKPELSLISHYTVDASEQYAIYVPFYSMRAAAGYLDNEQEL